MLFPHAARVGHRAVGFKEAPVTDALGSVASFFDGFS
jgi:hypothetical protein